MIFSNSVTLFYVNTLPIICNFETGYLIGLTEDGSKICKRLLAEEVSPSEIESVDSLLFKHLVKGGFFSSSDGESNKAYSAYIHISSNCNLNCVGCYASFKNENSFEMMEYSTAQLALDRLKELNIKRITISGGEPFLHPNLAEIVQYAKTICEFEKIEIVTNGTLVSDDVLRKIGSCVDRICVSIDGLSKDTQTFIRKPNIFNAVINGVEKIKNADIPVCLIPTIHAKNIDDIFNYIELANEIDVSISFSLLSAPPLNKEIGSLLLTSKDASELGQKLFNIWKQSSDNNDSVIGLNMSAKKVCGFGTGMLSISVDGYIFPCHMFHFDSFRMASIYDTDLSYLLNRSMPADIAVDAIEDCSQCEIKYLCGGGCRARSYYQYKDLKQIDPYCMLMKEYYGLIFKELEALKER